MQPTPHAAHEDRRRERGSVMVLAALAATALVLFAALALDVGFVWSSRTQSQNVADAAALAAAANMVSPGGLVITGTVAESAATAIAQNNSTVANPSVTVVVPGCDVGVGCGADIEYGTWDFANQTLKAPNDPSNAAHRTGVRVRVRMDGTDNARSPALLAGLGGITAFDVVNTATGYLGYEGCWDKEDFDLPIAIDECALSSNPSNGSPGGACGGPGPCASGAPHPSDACDLQTPQVGDPPIGTNAFTCLRLYNTPDQNACWTGFDGQNQNSTNTNTLKPMVGTGNPNGVQSGDSAYVSNGTATPMVQEIKDRFEGTGNYASQGPAGSDRYLPHAGPDSWVVRLPVIECQDTDHCAGPDPVEIVGAVCFEIREVHPNPIHEVRGRFLCNDSPDPVIQSLFRQHCVGLGSGGSCSGGCDHGLRASRPKLVQ